MKAVKFIFLQIILVIIFSLILEGMGQLYFFIKHGYTFKESLMYTRDKDLVYKLNPKYKGKDVMHNGFRGLTFSREKGSNTFRIIAVGGSTTWGGDNSYRDSWPFQLEILLNENEKENIRYEVINAGVSGYGSAQHYARSKKELLKLSPDMVIIYSAWNMVGGLDNDVYYWVPDNVVKPGSSVLEKISAFLTDNSVIFAKLRVMFPRYLDAFNLSVKNAEKLESRFTELIEKHKQYLKKTVQLLRENDVMPVLMKYPQVYKKGGLNEMETAMLKDRSLELFEYRDYLGRQYSLIIKKIDELGKENNVLIVDSSGCFDGFDFSKRLMFFKDQMHLTNEGFPIQAKAVYADLVKDPEFQSKRKEILNRVIP